MNAKEEKAKNDIELIEKIKTIIREDKNTTLEVADEDYDYVNFSTRENGDVGAEKYSMIDYEDAKRMQKILKEQFSGKISTDIETVDEFVYLNIELY